MRVIHWFRSDLRIEDNAALAAACAKASELVPVFVLDDTLLARHREARPRLRFLQACLSELGRALEGRGSCLVILRGDPRRRLPVLARACNASLVTWNRDYGPYAKGRDDAVRRTLERDGIAVGTFKDRVIFEGDEIRTGKGGAYSVYTPYRRAWWRRFHEEPPGTARIPTDLPPRGAARLPAGVPENPVSAHPTDSAGNTAAIGSENGRGGAGAEPPMGPESGTGRGAADTPSGARPTTGSDGESHPVLAAAARADTAELPPGGRAAARTRLDAFLGGPVRRYHVDRDYPAVAGTSRLSPYLRFGAISVRACFRAGLALARAEPGASEGVAKWLDELVWREFYHAILDAHPRVLAGPFRAEYETLEWDPRSDRLEAWRAGMTGYPLVDAGMRELAQTGWMHNRARMVAASFLAKDLHLDWRAGERWFMQRLVDGDPASNNGGWQWAASTGTDAQPYFRIFNPTAQGERFDPNGDYVRRWAPELAGLRGATAHRPWDAPGELRTGYPAPLVDHARERAVTLAAIAPPASATRSRGRHPPLPPRTFTSGTPDGDGDCKPGTECRGTTS